MSVSSYVKAFGSSTVTRCSVTEPPSAVWMVRTWPTVAHGPSWSTAVIGGIGPYRRLKRSGSGVARVTGKASSSATG